MAEYIEREKVIRQCEAIRDLAQKSLDEWKAHTREYRDTHMAQYLSASQRMQDVNDEFMRIMAIPAADVRPVVRGHWERTLWFVTCSVCEYTSADTDDEGSAISLNYCPNCGADMREEEGDG